MPIVKRTVSPTALCRQKIPRGLKNELECVTNNTLAGVIHQLASLSQHAEDIFGELFSEANSFYGRASSLKDRIDHLSVKVTQLDSNVEEVSLIDINSRKAFKSSVTTDQQVVSRQSLSRSVMNTYQQADAPPPLQELNQFRDDGKDGLKIYTDPDYFFDLWREAIQKETREAREKRREQRKRDRKANPDLRSKAKVRQAVNTRKLQAERMRHGAEFVDPVSKPSSASVRRSSTARKREQQQVPQKDYLPPPNELPNQQQQTSMPPPPPLDSSIPPPSSYPEPPMPMDYQGYAPPPPEPIHSPPPPPMMNDYAPPMSSPPPPPNMMNGEIPPPLSMGSAPPPPPLAPPPPNAPPPPPVPAVPSLEESAPSGLAAALQGVSLKKAEPKAPPPVDERSNLLAAIRIGINLKKVEEKERSEALPASGGNDVASILARRIAVEFSDSDVSDSTIASDDEWD